MKCHQDNSSRASLSRSWGPAQICCACFREPGGGSCGGLHGAHMALGCHVCMCAITGSQKPSQRAKGEGAVPRVTHLGASVRAGLCSDVRTHLLFPSMWPLFLQWASSCCCCCHQSSLNVWTVSAFPFPSSTGLHGLQGFSIVPSTTRPQPHDTPFLHTTVAGKSDVCLKH